jgi:oligosaccharyl transferase (archaeosortase A-associated)
MLERFLKSALPLLIIIGVSLFIRIVLPYDKIFTDLGIKFSGVDAYYHMRIVDNLVANFPHLTFYDPYYILPSGTILAGQHLFDWLLASVIWLIGLGHPTPHLIDVVGAYFPAILGALMVLPVYFIGKSIFNKYVGLIAAVLIAVFAGDFLGRSLLGSSDNHIAEVFFSTIAVLFALLAIKSIDKKRLVVYSILSGLFLGLYLLTWAGGLLFVFIISGYFVIQAIIDHMHRETKLNLIGVIMFPIALLMNYTQLPKVAVYTLALASLLPLLLYGISWLMRKRAVILYPLILLVLAVGVSLFTFKDFNIFLSSGVSVATTSELQPLFFVRGNFTTNSVWGSYTTSWVLIPVSFLILVLVYIKKRENPVLFLIVWTFIIAVLTLVQKRYAYYLTINVAILIGFLCHFTYQWLSKVLLLETARKSRIVRKNYIVPILFSSVIFFAIIFPNLAQDKAVARVAYAPSDAWQSSLLWMKENTPDPFDKKDVYYTNYPLNIYGLDPQKPENLGRGYIKPSYAVTSWWDYGYWITRIAHRVPNTNPSQATEPIKKVATLLLSDGESRDILNEFKTKYVILDWGLLWQKFTAVGEWIGKPTNYYIDVYYTQQGNKLTQVILFSQEYYKTLAVRLYNFNGEASDVKTAVVITYAIKDNKKIITSGKNFASYDEAQVYARKVSGIIVGVNPFVSPIPLEPMTDYKLVYSSKQVNQDNIPEVKIFEYLGRN